MSTQPDPSLIDDLVLANHILVNQGVLDGFGHISVRDPANPQRFFIARSMAPALVQADDIVVCDLDRKSRETFEEELRELAKAAHPCPEHAFCLAIEEGEAWFLGDIPAVKAAYPRAKVPVLNGYVNDSICGTWEKLADAVYPGGSAALQAKGWMTAGAEKSRWAREITPHMDPGSNQSPSFLQFVATLTEMAKS